MSEENLEIYLIKAESELNLDNSCFAYSENRAIIGLDMTTLDLTKVLDFSSKYQKLYEEKKTIGPAILGIVPTAHYFTISEQEKLSLKGVMLVTEKEDYFRNKDNKEEQLRIFKERIISAMRKYGAFSKRKVIVYPEDKKETKYDPLHESLLRMNDPDSL